jgi:hypothetical protein
MEETFEACPAVPVCCHYPDWSQLLQLLIIYACLQQVKNGMSLPIYE